MCQKGRPVFVKHVIFIKDRVQRNTALPFMDTEFKRSFYPTPHAHNPQPVLYADHEEVLGILPFRGWGKRNYRF